MSTYCVMGIYPDGTEVCLEQTETEELRDLWVDDHMEEYPDLVIYSQILPKYLN